MQCGTRAPGPHPLDDRHLPERDVHEFGEAIRLGIPSAPKPREQSSEHLGGVDALQVDREVHVAPRVGHIARTVLVAGKVASKRMLSLRSSSCTERPGDGSLIPPETPEKSHPLSRASEMVTPDEGTLLRSSTPGAAYRAYDASMALGGIGSLSTWVEQSVTVTLLL